MCKALVHDNSTLKYVNKLVCQNPMSVSGRNWRDCINFAHDINMISMNVKQVYSQWYDTINDNEIDSVCILREMIEVREGRAKCDISTSSILKIHKHVRIICNCLQVKLLTSMA